MLELVDNGLDHRPFAHQQFIPKGPQMVLHVFAQPGDELKPLFKEQFAQGSGNVATIPEQLATQVFDHGSNGSAIIDLAGSQTTGQHLAVIIDGQVQFEAEEPAHARLATSGIRRKDALSTDPFGVTDLQRSRVDEADARAGSVAALQIGEHRNHHGWNERDQARIAHQVRKFLGQMHLDMLRVIGFKSTIVRLMKVNENGHHLTWAQLAFALSPLAGLQLSRFPWWLKAEPQVIDSTK